MKPEEIIKSILSLLSTPNENFDGNIYSFKYTGNIKTENDIYHLKTNPSLSICGKEDIERYNELFKELMKSLCGEKRLSLNTFMNATQNLIFEGRFNVKEIKAILEKYEEVPIQHICKVYGLDMKTDNLQLGSFVIINKTNMLNYIKDYSFGKNGDWIKEKLFEKISKDEDDDAFVYVSYKTHGYDTIESKIDFAKIIDSFIKVVRYISRTKNDRVLIDSKPFFTYTNSSLHVFNEEALSFDSNIVRKDIPILIDDPFLIDHSLGNDKIWELLSNDKRDELENRILNAIIWIGESIVESDDNKIIAEIAFAFETLLHNDDEVYSSKGVVASLAEAVAFINGDTVEKRIKLEKDFKDFYKRRSSVAHGARISKNNMSNVTDYYNMIYNTITNLLIKPEFRDCKTSKSLYEVIQSMRYK